LIRVTADTNILASGLTRQGRSAAGVIENWRSGAIVLVTSAYILDELARAFAKPYFASSLSAGRAAELVRLVATDSILVEPLPDVQGIAPHAEDDMVLATALGGASDVLCTGDKRLLKLRAFQGVEILSPRELLYRIVDGERTVAQ
jgi:putative PIN family toxin of toxin-antitoxin system